LPTSAFSNFREKGSPPGVVVVISVVKVKDFQCLASRRPSYLYLH